MDGRDFSLENLSDQTAAGLKLLVFFNLKASDSFFLSLFGFKGQLAAATFIPSEGQPITYMIPRRLKRRQI